MSRHFIPWSFVYRVVKGRNAIDSGLGTALISQKQELEPYYHHEDVEFEQKDEDGTTEPIVRPTFLCHDMEELAAHVAQERNVELNDCLLKFSIDKGHDKLKAGLSIIEPESLEMNPRKRARYEDGIAPALHKSTSANRMQIVAMVPSIQESYNNIKTIINNLPGKYSE